MSSTETIDGKLLQYQLLGPRCCAGIPVRTTLDNSTTVQYAGLLHSLTAQARNCVRDIDPQNDLTFLRIRSRKNEIMVAPGLLLHIVIIISTNQFLAYSKNELIQWRGIRRLSVCLSVNFCANRFSQTNGWIATKLAQDGLQVSVHPGCAQGQGSRNTRTFLILGISNSVIDGPV